MAVLAASLSGWSFPLTSVCPGQDIHESFRNFEFLDTCQSGLHRPFCFTSTEAKMLIRDGDGGGGGGDERVKA